MKLSVTPSGVDMILHALELQGNNEAAPIKFKSLVLGNGEDAGSEASAMSNPMQIIDIDDLDREEGSEFVTLTGTLNNNGITERFRSTEMGVLAVDPDNETETILFAYGFVPNEEATIIPAATDYAFETVMKCMVYVGKTQDITAIISESMATVSRAEFELHKGDITNPHKVSAEQVGLGNVPNVDTDDQTPTVSYNEDLAYSGSYSDLTGIDINELLLAEGDNMGIIIQKLASAVKEMLYHVRNSSNPHNSTPTNTGSAPRSHNHSASNITSGTLSVTRGGTGQTSLSGLANALGSYFSIPVFGTYAGNGGTKRKIELPFTPSAVLVVDAVGMLSDDIKGTCGGLAVGSAGVVAYGASETYATSWNNSYTALMITDNGFFVNYSSSQKVRTNTSGASYRYIAWK